VMRMQLLKHHSSSQDVRFIKRYLSREYKRPA